MGQTMLARVHARVTEVLHSASSSAPAVETPSAVARLHRSVGNTVVQASLAGAEVGGFGAVVRGAIMGQVAGTGAVVPGEAPNSVMLAVLRHAQGRARGGFRLPAGGGTELPTAVRARMETAFGHDFEHVRIHADSQAADSAKAIDAYAYTVGSDIYFGRGQFAPGTTKGDRLLAHELTHVVQDDEGRLSGKHGVSSPTDPTELEAYAMERTIASTLPADAGPGEVTRGEAGADGSEHAAGAGGAGGDTSTYAGGPPAMRDAQAPAAPSGAGARTGPTSSEEALLGPLPTADQARAEVAPVAEPAVTGQVREPGASPEVVAPAEVSAASSVGTADVAPVQGSTLGVGADGAVATGVSPVSAEAPAVGDLAGWAPKARQEGSVRVQAIREAARAAKSAVTAAGDATRAAIGAAVASARASIEAAAAAALTAIQSRRDAATATVDTAVADARGRAEASFEAECQAARQRTDETRARIAAAARTEAARVREGSAQRAETARALAEQTGTGGDQPLAEGQADMARRTATELAAQLVQTGEDAAAKLEAASTSRSDGLDQALTAVLETLDAARTRTLAALDTTRDEAHEALTREADAATGRIEAGRGEALSVLVERDEAAAAWIGEQVGAESARIDERAEEWAATIGDGYTRLASAYEAAAAEVEAILTGSPDASPESVAAARASASEQLATAWAQNATPLGAEADRAVAGLEEHASGVATGFGSVCEDAARTLAEAATGSSDALARLAEGYSVLADGIASRVSTSAADGVTAALGEAQRAGAEHTSQLLAEEQAATGAFAKAVDDQLAWEDAQITEAAAKIAEGQARASSEYGALKAEAEQKNAASSSASVHRGWLGDLWDFFADWAESVLEWFQEKLGRVFGGIIGWILKAIIYVLGVIVCALAWVGAQLVNLLWGFIWGETAIPGYGGGLFAFIGDLVAGVLVYGDVRDVVKYAIRLITGDGPWWFNLLMIAVAAIGLIPVVGDIGKALVRKLLKKALSETMERLVTELGKELAEKLVKEIGEELTEELVERLGKETLERLSKELGGRAIHELTEKIGELTLTRLAKELGATAITKLADDLGGEALEKLARTLGGTAIQELNEKLGKDAIVKLLDGLRGVTVKEYMDLLGADVLKKLARDLDGYAVRELVDDLGAETLKKLGADLEGAAIKAVVDGLGSETLKKLAADLSGTAIKQLSDDLGAVTLKKLAEELTGTACKQLSDDLGAVALKTLAEDLSGTAIKQLSDELGAEALKKLAAELSGTAIKELTDTLGAAALRELAGNVGEKGVKELYDTFGAAGIKGLVDELGQATIKELGTKALKEIGAHLSPAEIKQWVADLGAPRVKEVAEKYAGDAMKHYGSAWFKAYKGITSHTSTHAITGHGVNNGKVSGCHDTDNFLNTFVNTPPPKAHIHSQNPSGDLTEFSYSLMKADGSGPKAAVHTKTTLQDLATRWSGLEGDLTAALDELIKNKTFPKTPGGGPPLTAGGYNWSFFFRNDQIDSIFPTL